MKEARARDQRPGTSDEFLMVAPDRIAIRPGNPRQGFDEERLNELAASLGEHGMIEPMIVRERKSCRHGDFDSSPANHDGPCGPVELRYELVAGERRYRAALIAGLGRVPVIVRDLDDRAADEIRLIENIQREDLTILEEAEALDRLHREHAHTVEGLAQKLGRSRRHIYQRLQVARIHPEARETLQSGKVGATIVTLVARIADPGKQAEFVKEVIKPKWGDEPLTFKRAEEILNRDYQISLGKAQFPTKDTTLLPEAGACSDCPKNTSNQPDGGGSANVCTDVACFGRKQQAFVRRLQQEGSCTVLSPKKMNRVIPYGSHLSYGSGLVDIDDPCQKDSKRPPRTWRKLLGKSASLQEAGLSVGQDKAGRIHYLLPERAAGELLAKVHPDIANPPKSEADREWEARLKRMEAQRALDKKVAREAIRRVVAEIESRGDLAQLLPAVRVLLERDLEHQHPQAIAICERRGIEAEQAAHWLPDLSLSQLLGFLIELQLTPETAYGSTELLKAMLEALDLDYNQIKKEVHQRSKVKP